MDWLLSDEEIQRAFRGQGKAEKLDKYGMYGATRTVMTYNPKNVAKAQAKKLVEWFGERECKGILAECEGEQLFVQYAKAGYYLFAIRTEDWQALKKDLGF